MENHMVHHKREIVLAKLHAAVLACKERGGLVALVGGTGFGKTVAALQFSTLHGLPVFAPGPAGGNVVAELLLPKLESLSIIDEADGFPNAAARINEYVVERAGTVIVVCTDASTAATLCLNGIAALVQVPHWETGAVWHAKATLAAGSITERLKWPDAYSIEDLSSSR
jgi:hypothetical protein